MSKVPRNVSGDEVVKVLCKHFGFHHVHQKGSHVKLALKTADGILSQTIAMHKPLKTGALDGIFRQVAQKLGMSKAEFERKFLEYR